MYLTVNKYVYDLIRVALIVYYVYCNGSLLFFWICAIEILFTSICIIVVEFEHLSCANKRLLTTDWLTYLFHFMMHETSCCTVRRYATSVITLRREAYQIFQQDSYSRSLNSTTVYTSSWELQLLLPFSCFSFFVWHSWMLGRQQ